MRVLLDECVPKRLGRAFPSHDLHTIPQMGWSGKKNGELLSLMTAAGFEVLLTVDRNLVRQQNLNTAGIAVIVMVAGSTKLSDLLPLVPAVETALASIKPGDAVEVKV